MKQKKNNLENVKFVNDYEVNITVSKDSPMVFPAHWHTYAEFVLALEDHCIYTINGNLYEINKGDLLLIWPTEVHATISTPPRATILLQFNSSILNHLKDINMNRYSLQSHHHVMYQDRKELAVSLTACMEKSHEIYFSAEPFIETKIKIQIATMLTLLATDAMKSLSNIAFSSSGATADSFLKINNACTYINENCEKDLTQEMMAEYVGFSRYHFARLFKEYTSTTFVHYITKQRLQKTVELLGDPNMSITSIAYQAGFQSISNFNRVFKEVKGCSPKEYRKMYYYMPQIQGSIPGKRQNM